MSLSQLKNSVDSTRWRPSPSHLLVAGLAAVLMIACSSREITRDEAARLIEGSPELDALRSTVPLHREGFAAGVEQEYWGRKGVLFEHELMDVVNVSDSSIVVQKPLGRIEVAVTGIAAASPAVDVREVQFTYRHRDIPSPLVRFCSDGGSGRAFVRKFDDGWRLVEVSARPATTAPQLEPSQLAAQEQRIGAVRAKRAERARLLEAASVLGDATYARTYPTNYNASWQTCSDGPEAALLQAYHANAVYIMQLEVLQGGLRVNLRGRQGGLGWGQQAWNLTEVREIHFSDIEDLNVNEMVDRLGRPLVSVQLTLPPPMVFGRDINDPGLIFLKFLSPSSGREAASAMRQAMDAWRTRYPEVARHGRPN